MTSISFATYALAIKKKRADDYVDLSDVESSDFLDVFQQFLGSLAKGKGDDDIKDFVLSSDPIVKGRQLSGMLHVGNYGFTSELRDRSTRELKYEREVDDAELLPFYFLIDVPKDKRRCFLILQRFGNSGVFTALSRRLKAYFKEKFDGYILEIEEVVLKDLVDAFRSGEPKKIRLRKTTIPQDICDSLGGNLEPEDGHIELRVVVKKGKKFSGVKQLLSGKSEGQVLTLPDVEYFEADEKLIEVELNGKRRMLNVDDPGRIRSYVDVTKEVKFSDGGHPTRESVHTAAVSLMRDLWSEMTGAKDD